MNNSQVADKFARLETKGKGSNMFIDGDTIYSYGYHFPIARHTDKTYNGHQIVLFNSRGYSNSTSKHQLKVRWALHADYFIVEVNLSNSQLDWVNELEERRDTAEKKGKRARADHMKEYYKNVVSNTLDQLKAVKFFNVTNKPIDSKRDDNELKSVAMVARLGDIFGSDQKESNDWKTRMIKAGLENKGLIMPDDWDGLSEDEKQSRLDGVINILSE